MLQTQAQRPGAEFYSDASSMRIALFSSVALTHDWTLSQVPKQYEVFGYNPHSVADASSGYVPPKLVRSLRVGAEVQY